MDVDSQLPIHIYPPNKILDSSEIKHSKKPELHPYLCNLDVNEDGKCLVTTNDLTGRIWNGCVFLCANTDDLCNLKYKETFVSEFGISNAKFLTKTSVLIGENSPSLSIIEPQEEYGTCRVVDTYLLDERILDSLVLSKEKAVTCSENNVIVWSFADGNIKPSQEFPSCDMQEVTAISSVKQDENMFLSADSQGMVLLWDLRLDKPAKVVYHNEFSPLSSLDTTITRSNLVAVGSDDGDLYLLDLRQPKEFTAKSTVPDGVRIHRVKFSDKGVLGLCADATFVKAFNYLDSEVKEIFSDDDSHQMFVRDLIWWNGDLISCGFDKKVIHHKLT